MKYFIFNVKLRSEVRKGYEGYISLFLDSFNNRETIYLNGDKQAILREYFHSEIGQTNLYNKKIEDLTEKVFYYGNITKFVKITNKKWMNIQNNQIEDNDILPKDKFPNADDIEFFFFPQIHRIFIKYGKVGVKSLEKFITQFFMKGLDTNERLDIHIEQDSQAIDIIKTAQELHRLEISITPTNDDPLADDIQVFIDKDIKESKSQGINVSYKDSKGKEGLKFTPLMDILTFLAKKNGEILAKIKRNGSNETIKASDHPNFTEISKEKGMEKNDIGKKIFDQYNLED